jgi:hypothetical protein
MGHVCLYGEYEIYSTVTRLDMQQAVLSMPLELCQGIYAHTHSNMNAHWKLYLLSQKQKNNNCEDVFYNLPIKIMWPFRNAIAINNTTYMLSDKQFNPPTYLVGE